MLTRGSRRGSCRRCRRRRARRGCAGRRSSPRAGTRAADRPPRRRGRRCPVKSVALAPVGLRRARERHAQRARVRPRLLVARLGDGEPAVLRDEERVDVVDDLRRVLLERALDGRDGDRAQHVLGQAPRLDRQPREVAAEQHREEMRRPLGQPHPARRAPSPWGRGTACSPPARRPLRRAPRAGPRPSGSRRAPAPRRSTRRGAASRRRWAAGAAGRPGRAAPDRTRRGPRRPGASRTSAARSAARSTRLPRATLTRTAPGFMRASSSGAEQRLALADGRRVQRHDVGLREQLVERHERHAHLARLLGRQVRVVAEQPRLERARPRRHARADLARGPRCRRSCRRARRRRTSTSPTCPPPSSRRPRGSRRSSAKSTANVCSTAETTLPVGEFRTSTPRAEAAGTSTLSTPTPARPTTVELRRGGEELRVHLRRAPHEQRVGVLERGEQVLARDAREVDDLVARLAQQIEPGGRDLLGDDDAAHADLPRALVERGEQGLERREVHVAHVADAERRRPSTCRSRRRS